MRKYLALLLALLLGGAGTAWACASLRDSADDVVITERILAGERSAAEGIKLDIGRYWRNQLFWTSHYELDSGTYFTDYRYSQEREYEEYELIPSGVMLSDDISTSYDMNESWHPLYPAFQELDFATAPGTEESGMTVKVADYYDYYPISVTVDLPNASWTLSQREFGMGFYNDGSDELGLSLYQRFNEFFRIPVMEEESLRLSIGKNAQGMVQTMGVSTTRHDGYYLWAQSQLAEDAAYFIINNRSREGKLMDLSLVPGGYGIYRLPYHLDSENGAYVRENGRFELRPMAVPEPEGLEMTYALPEEADICLFELSPDGENILLVLKNGGVAELLVIECGSMKTLQRLELANTGPESLTSSYFYVAEGFMVVMVEDGRLLLLTESDGVYDICFTADISGMQLLNFREQMAWDGRRLVIVNNGTGDNDVYRYHSCNFSVAVLTAEGLVFHGEYVSSLSAGESDEGYNSGIPYANDRNSFTVVFE